MKIDNYKLKISLIVLAFFLLSNQASAATIDKPSNYLALNTGLVGWWTFDGNNMKQNVADSSGTGNTGYILSANNGLPLATSTVPGKIGQALNFDGLNTFVNTSSNVLGTGPTTILAWIKVASFANSRQNIVSNGTTRFRINAVNLGFTSDGLTHEVFDCSVLSQNVWYHVAATRDVSGLATFYMNGAQCSSSNQNSGTPGAGAVTAIGGDLVAAAMFQGSLDDVRVYNRVLSATEIRQIYNMGR